MTDNAVVAVEWRLGSGGQGAKPVLLRVVQNDDRIAVGVVPHTLVDDGTDRGAHQQGDECTRHSETKPGAKLPDHGDCSTG